MAYTDDDDLLERRSNIISLGVASWTDTHTKAKALIDLDLEGGWYRQAAEVKGVDPRVTPFDADLMLNSDDQLKDLSVFKVLELAYEYLSKDSETDVYMKLSDRYSKKYEIELKKVIIRGIDYDWDASEEIDDSERSYERLSRRLSRV